MMCLVMYEKVLLFASVYLYSLSSQTVQYPIELFTQKSVLCVIEEFLKAFLCVYLP